MEARRRGTAQVPALEFSALSDAEMECRSGDVRGNLPNDAGPLPLSPIVGAACIGHDHRFGGLVDSVRPLLPPPPVPPTPADSMEAVDHRLFFTVKLVVDARPDSDVRGDGDCDEGVGGGSGV